MSLGQWTRRQGLLHALRRLAGGEAVNTVALELGYNGASAFIAMFRRELGRRLANTSRRSDALPQKLGDFSDPRDRAPIERIDGLGRMDGQHALAPGRVEIH